ncbi:MAG: methyltransferase [Magnetococcales bacterium]|nr:methyltransferase [Magnetococcales bacterium]
MQQLVINGTKLRLQRLPSLPNETLLAWDAADELALQAHELPRGNRLVLNDHFGALACGLAVSAPNAPLYWVNDSRTSHQALQSNLERNGIVHPIQTDAEIRRDKPNPLGVLLKLPRNMRLLTAQLDWLNKNLPQGTPLVIAARQKDMPTTLPDLTRRLLDAVRPSRAVKKARLIYGQLSGRTSGQGEITEWYCEQVGSLLSHFPNVYGSQRLDSGARLLLQNLGSIPNRVVDLGCGNGVLSLAALRANPECQLLAVDESWDAIRSSRLNLERFRNGDPFNLDTAVSAVSRLKLIWSNGLSEVQAEPVDLVLCNPPFHQHQTVTDLVAWQLFKDARQILKTGGRLRMVGNRHLGYHAKLSKLFGQCQIIAVNPKFVVLETVKR